MKIIFKKDYLKEIHTTGKARNKKYRFQPNIIKKYVETINILETAKKTEELYRFKSLKYKKLSGDKKGLESVRVNNQYRIEFISKVEGEITICSIIELSNHYKSK